MDPEIKPESEVPASTDTTTPTTPESTTPPVTDPATPTSSAPTPDASVLSVPSPAKPADTAVTPPAPLWQAPQGQLAAGGSHRGKILGIIGAIVAVVLLIVGILGYLFVFSATAQAKNTSTLFMHYMTTGDPTRAAKYSTGSVSDLNTFVSTVKGSSSLGQSTLQNGTGYYLYNLTAKEKYARTTVKKTNGTWKVVSLVTSNSALLLIPKAGTASTKSTTATTAPASACLTTGDYTSIVNEIDETHTTNAIAYNTDNPFLQNVHFNADATTFVDPVSSQEGMVGAFANFYKAHKDKSFTIHLQGSVATTAASDLAFATQRAQKVQSLLETDGVPAASIVIDAPQSISAYGSDQVNNSSAQDSARNVVLTIMPATNCGTTGATSDSGQ